MAGGGLKKWLLFAILVVVCSFAGASKPQSAFADEKEAVVAAATSRDLSYVYQLGTGDKIRVIVFGETDLGGEFTVGADGTISLPLVGGIKAVGLTAAELQTAIETALKDGYLNDPKVNVEVLTFRPFYILGEVNKPGEYEFSNGLTVVKAVAMASGYTYRADKAHVFIEHAGKSVEARYDLTSSLPVMPGDTIRIGERYF